MVQSSRVEARGPAPGAFPCGCGPVSKQGGPEPGSVVAAELAWAMSEWGGLSPDIRAAILAIVEAAQGR